MPKAADVPQGEGLRAASGLLCPLASQVTIALANLVMSRMRGVASTSETASEADASSRVSSRRFAALCTASRLPFQAEELPRSAARDRWAWAGGRGTEVEKSASGPR